MQDFNDEIEILKDGIYFLIYLKLFLKKLMS